MLTEADDPALLTVLKDEGFDAATTIENGGTVSRAANGTT
jgi:hypothetical protein